MVKPDPSRNAPEEVSAYLDALPEGTRASLQRVREIVRKLAPGCTERVSYGIPIFRLHRDLVGISASKNHCSLHTMSPPLAKSLKDAREDITVSGATVHFTTDTPLPEEVLAIVVQARIKDAGGT